MHGRERVARQREILVRGYVTSPISRVDSPSFER